MLERGREIENQWFTKHPLLAEAVILAIKGVSAKSPKEKKAERPKPKHILAENFGQN